MMLHSGNEGSVSKRALSGGRSLARDVLRNDNLARFLFLLALVIGFAIVTQGAMVSGANVANVLVQSAIAGIAACGQAFVVLTAGLDLSVSGVVAVSMMIGGSLITSDPRVSLLGSPVSPLLALPLMIIVAGAFGVANGYLVARFRLPALVVTLGSWQIANGLAYQVTGKGFVDKIPAGIAAMGQGQFLSLPIPVIVLFAIVGLSYFLLHHTPFGAQVYAIGGNPKAAFISGVPVQRIRIMAFGIAGLLYGVGAVISMSSYLSATMAQTAGLELSTISAVAIGGVSLSGGKGTMIGVLIGTLIIGVVDNGLSIMGVGPAYQAILKGLIIIAAVAPDSFRRR
jgi:ribose/xylose/arabinose/galactoside ABC-type transport system permease subunit